MFFKIERWNFQHLFEKEFRETSQNFNSFSFFRQLLFPFFFYQLSDWVEILWGFTKFNFKLNLKVSAFYLERQKSFIPKKKFFLAVVNIKTKNLCLLTQFSRRFWWKHVVNSIKDDGNSSKYKASPDLQDISTSSLVRKFSVDPNLTSYETLRSLLSRAFDLKDDASESFR